jgi:hypothetical protein
MLSGCVARLRSLERTIVAAATDHALHVSGDAKTVRDESQMDGTFVAAGGIKHPR